jgi:hypothetical protein
MMGYTGVKFDMKNKKTFINGIERKFRKFAEDAGRYRKKVARRALEETVKYTAVWTGNTQASIRLSENSPAPGRSGRPRTKGERGTNFMPLGVGAEARSNPSQVMSQLSNLRKVKDYRKMNQFYITASSKATDLGVFEGRIPNNPKHNLKPRVPKDALERIARAFRRI